MLDDNKMLKLYCNTFSCTSCLRGVVIVRMKGSFSSALKLNYLHFLSEFSVNCPKRNHKYKHVY